MHNFGDLRKVGLVIGVNLEAAVVVGGFFAQRITVVEILGVFTFLHEPFDLLRQRVAGD